jgi:TIR domain
VADEGDDQLPPAEAGSVDTYDVFLSYAGEDREIAEELALALRGTGFNVWYDKFQLRAGDQLLARINEGLTNSRYGLLLISEAFLAKRWPGYEMDALVRDQIEGRKVLFPIWHGVGVDTVRAHQPGLAGVVALNTEQGVYELVVELAGVMVEAARTIAFVPGYMDPVLRFLRGSGELTLRPGHGGAFTIWEALVQFGDDRYPMWVGGRMFTRDDLLHEASAAILKGPEGVVAMVGEDGLERIRRMLIERGYDPDA